MTADSEFISAGRKDCADMHSWGPGTRTCYVVHYIIKGKGTFIKNGKAYTAESGESFVIRPFDNIAYFPDESDPWEYAWIDFTGERYSSLFKKINYLKGDCIIGAVPLQKLLSFFEMLCGLEPYPSDINTARGLLLTVLGIYADTFPNIAENGRSGYYETACRLINQNFYKDDLDLAAICDFLGVSRSTLHRCFMNMCGISPGAYLTKYRITRAKELLEHGVSVKSTALSCGFGDPLYFSKSFKKTFGISPNEYRKSFLIKKRSDKNGKKSYRGRSV